MTSPRLYPYYHASGLKLSGQTRQIWSEPFLCHSIAHSSLIAEGELLSYFLAFQRTFLRIISSSPAFWSMYTPKVCWRPIRARTRNGTRRTNMRGRWQVTTRLDPSRRSSTSVFTRQIILAHTQHTISLDPCLESKDSHIERKSQNVLRHRNPFRRTSSSLIVPTRQLNSMMTRTPYGQSKASSARKSICSMHQCRLCLAFYLTNS